MAIKELAVRQNDRNADRKPVWQLVRGDARTTIIRLIIERYYGGVDLAPLVWSVTAKNAAGDADTYFCENVQHDDSVIRADWLIQGIATAAAGRTQFEVEGVRLNEAEGAPLWQSDTYYIEVSESLAGQPSEEEQQQLSAVQELIAYVGGVLPQQLETIEKAANDAEAVVNRLSGVTFEVDDQMNLLMHKPD